MSTDTTMNPYAAPEAELNEINGSGEIKFTDAQKLTVGGGIGIISDAWNLYKKAPIKWVFFLLLLFAVSMVLNLIPFVGIVFYVLFPFVFTAGLYIGANELSQDRALRFAHLFSGFKQNLGGTVILGLVYNIVTLMLIGIVFFLMGGEDFVNSSFANLENDPAAQLESFKLIGLATLVFLAIFIPWMMAIVYAVPLVALQGESVFTALGKSFMGCLKNMIPLLVNGIVFSLLLLVSMIPFGLGLLITGPMVLIAIYTGYRRIFTEM